MKAQSPYKLLPGLPFGARYKQILEDVIQQLFLRSGGDTDFIEVAQGDIERLDEEQAAQNASIASNKQLITSNQASIAQNTQSIQSNTASISTLNAQVATLQTDLEAAEATIVAQGLAITQLQTDYIALEQRVTDLENP